ncbi:hypothetical protein FPZ24_08205 [Sphingomonas panacisoli]|uniref:Portal protein n=1 Tax=Sphingomonas panacisoli TaxID=1813879 RepID=A0A5B8LI10_9SPHN|nr:portal protein [Sphingomonas panacisoli]QDZ07465.1 hypothetical protein FPZ24_08205 [Sphingomonas panacisoli]
MSDAPTPESDIEEGGAEADSKRLQDVWETALTEFDAVSTPLAVQQLRAESLEDRAFTVRTGAMWEGPWGDNAENSPRPEIDKITKTKDKILDDWNKNRVVVDFVPANDAADEMTAETLDGLYRADCYHYNASQARDNAVREAVGGGFGAYRLSTDYEDPSDPDNEHQRVIPGIMIPDADQSVYFYGGVSQDGSDAESAFIITRDLIQIAKAKWGEDNLNPWPSNQWKYQWDWYTTDTACIAEYYKKEVVDADRIILTNPLTDEVERYFEDEITAEALSEKKATGWKRRTRKNKRTRVHKYILNGTKVLKDCGYIAGENIPIVPVYGNTEFVDGVRYWWGYTRKRKDRNRILNTAVGNYVETASLAPYDVPIVAPEQMTDEIAADWANANIDRKPFLYLLPLRNEDGSIASTQIGTRKAPEVSAATAQLLQLVIAEAADDAQDVEEVRANTSYEAMDLAAERVDARSAIYIDNACLAVQREGVIYESMARAVYFEDGRKVETRTEEGQDGTATLMQPVTSDNGAYGVRNDLSKGTYKCVATVQQATATVQQREFNQCVAMAEAAAKAGDQELAQVYILRAATAMRGSTKDVADWARKKLLGMGIGTPTKEEAAELARAAQEQGQPSAAEQALQAQTAESASKVQLNQAKTQESAASAALKLAQAEAVGGPEAAPDVPSGLDHPAHPNNVVDATEKIASARLKDAQARKIDHEIGHQRIKLGSELTDAEHQREMDRRAADRDDRANDAA